MTVAIESIRTKSGKTFFSKKKQSHHPVPGKSGRVEKKVDSNQAGTLSDDQLERMVEKYKSDAQALCFAALGFYQKGNFQRALQVYSYAHEIHPRNEKVINSMANCLKGLGNYDQAIGLYRRALQYRPGDSSILLNRAITRLHKGDYGAAWEDYEQRLSMIQRRSEVSQSSKPAWKGETLGPESTLFIYGNQGLGDELMCTRFLPEVAKRVDRIILEVQKPLYTLYENFEGMEKVQAYEKEAIPSYTHHAEIFSLPGIFELQLESIPNPICPRFDRDDQITDKIRSHRETKPTDHRHIGIAWSGNPKNDINHLRRIPLKAWREILETEGCSFYSLQKGDPSKELDSVGEGFPVIIDLSPDLHDMRATATAIEELDLVITVDTSIPHLTGTIGEKGWVLLHNPSDWRWNADRQSSPWYPSLELFTQREALQWGPVITEVAERLSSWR